MKKMNNFQKWEKDETNHFIKKGFQNGQETLKDAQLLS